MSFIKNLNEMEPGAKLGLGVGLVILTGVTLLALFWLASEKYSVLFSDVNQQDGAGILNELERMKITYRVDQGGARILVPQDQVHETRLKLMGAGTPLSGGVGFEVFDNSEFGMTEFAQKINFQRALQGELTRTIMSLRAVKFARVHLVMPERGLFNQKDNPPSASVTLFLRQGQQLDKTQIIGIQNLVAASVSGLDAKQVTVVDQDGMTLSPRPYRQDMQMVSDRLQQKQAVENYLTSKVNEVLSRAFGSNQAMVSVDVVINFDQIRTTRENITPGGSGSDSVLRRRESKFAGDSDQSTAGGNTTTEIEYIHGRTVAEIVEIPGRVERINVGVLVPSDAEESRYARIRELISVTVGLDPARGDAIAIYPASPLRGTVEETSVVASVTKPEPLSDKEMMGDQTMPVAELSGVPQIDQWLLTIRDKPLLIAGVSALTVIILLCLVALIMPRRSHTDSKIALLSDEKREQMLIDLEDWLMADNEIPADRSS